MFARGEYVYLFLRERAIESIDATEVYGRVARVCANDRGSMSETIFMSTFMKARLNCSLAGQPNVYFNELR
jgi:hypothetical protein